MKKRALLVANVASMIDQFNRSNIRILHDLGYEIHVAANFEDGNTTSKERTIKFKEELLKEGVTIYQIPIVRHFGLSNSNLKAYKILENIIKENHYSLIHCHSPIGGILTRLAARFERNKGTKVISTAHGFLFYKGAPIKNWLFYYPIERFMARYTDILITINKEDYNIAQKFKAKKVVYIPGIGIDTNKFSSVLNKRIEKRKELNLNENLKVLLSIGELTKRKNHESIIKAISKINGDNFLYLICGRGELEFYLKELTKTLNVESKVKFLGYRNDISEICISSDIFLFPSYQEGLPVALIEAMSSGLPIICSEIRGNNDLIRNNEGGILVKPADIDGYANAIRKLIIDIELQKKMALFNKEEVKKYDKTVVDEKMSILYKEL
jgi:Glycosyltransferase